MVIVVVVVVIVGVVVVVVNELKKTCVRLRHATRHCIHALFVVESETRCHHPRTIRHVEDEAVALLAPSLCHKPINCKLGNLATKGGL